MNAAPQPGLIDPRPAVEQMIRQELGEQPTKDRLVSLIEGAASNLSQLFNDNARVGVFTREELAVYSFCSVLLGSFIKAFATEDSLAFGDAARLSEQLVAAMNDPRGRVLASAKLPRFDA